MNAALLILASFMQQPAPQPTAIAFWPYNNRTEWEAASGVDFDVYRNWTPWETGWDNLGQ